MTTCRRFYRESGEFSLCVNIGKKDYVLAENPKVNVLNTSCGSFFVNVSFTYADFPVPVGPQIRTCLEVLSRRSNINPT